MTRTLRLCGLASLAVVSGLCATSAFAQTANPAPTRQQAREQAREMRGKIVRTAPDQIVVQTSDNKEITVYTNPQTRYLVNNKAARYEDLRVGSNVNFAYGMEGTRYIANTVTLVPVQPGVGVNVQPGRVSVNVQPAQPAVGTVVEGKVLRVVGQDQVILRTADGKEVVVYVSPQTTYQFTDQGGTFTDLRPGSEVSINYDVRDRRFQARRIYRRNNR